jgi:fluoride exporter
MSVLVWAGVVLIGGCGAVARFVVDAAVGTRLGRQFPYGTLAINVTGALVLGFLAGLAVGDDAALLAGTAAVGSYTTFSTWVLETQRLDEERQHWSSAANIVVSIAIGIAAAALGRAIGRHA